MPVVIPGTDSLPSGKYSEQMIVVRNHWKTYQAISIRVNSGAQGVFAGNESLPTRTNSGTLQYWANIRQIIVLGRPQSGKLVSLTATKTDTGDKYFDSDAYARLIDSNFGWPSVKIVDDLGEVSDAIAEAVGRAELKAALLRGKVREYTFDVELAALPLPFQTVDFADSWSGVVLDVKFEMSGGAETTVITAVDLT